jgi:hypothetical protein
VKVLNLDTTAAARPTLDDVQRLNELLGEATYSPPDKEEIKQLLRKHDVENEDKRPFFIQQVRGKLYSQKQGMPLGVTNISQIIIVTFQFGTVKRLRRRFTGLAFCSSFE